MWPNSEELQFKHLSGNGYWKKNGSNSGDSISRSFFGYYFSFFSIKHFLVCYTIGLIQEITGLYKIK